MKKVLAIAEEIQMKKRQSSNSSETQ